MIRQLEQIPYIKDLVKRLRRNRYLREACGYRDKTPTEKKTGKQDTPPEGAGGTPRKTPKTGPLIETIDKTIALLHEEPQKSRLYATKNVAHPRRTGKPKWPRFSSQHIRRQVTRGIGKVLDFALQNTKNEELDLAEREKWGRLAAYTTQTINSITKTYSKVFKGRSISGGKYEYNTFFNPWAWEFNTKANEFEVYVEVPDSLDIFELRLFLMAQPSNEIGYNLTGVGTPSGDLLNSSITSGIFGGYDTSTDKGQRNIIASGEYPGDDVRIYFNSSENDGVQTFYYIVLIAEYFEGEVKFWVKTDFTEPILTNVNNVTVGISDSPTEIMGNVDSNNEIKEAYIEYSTDDWASKAIIPLFLNRDNDYAGTIPAYGLHTTVDYRVKIQDTLNNIGTLHGNYTVLDPVTTSLSLSRSSIVGGQNIQVTGECSIPNASINLTITHAEFTNTFDIETDEDGRFILAYGPPQDGSYTVSFTFDGDENHMSAISPLKSFTVTKPELELNIGIDTSEYKLNQSVIIQGSVSPPTAGVILDLNIVTPTTYRVESVVTTDAGTFYATIIPSELGTWEILPQLRNTNLTSVASNEVVRFNVIQLTTTEKLVQFLQPMTKFPGVIIPVGLIITIIVGLELKTGYFRSLLEKQNEKKAQDETPEEESKSNGPSSYRMRSKKKKDSENSS